MTMTVTELKRQLESLESIGKGGLLVVINRPDGETVLAAKTCGTMRAWPDNRRLRPGVEFRGEGQRPDKTEPEVELVIID